MGNNNLITQIMKTNLFYTLVLSILCLYSTQAQDNPMKASSQSKAAYMRVIPPLSSMDNIIAAKGFEHVAPPKRRGTNTVVPGKGLPKNGDPLVIAQKSAATRQANTPIASFGAHAGTVLNDATGAIGPNHYVYAFNSGFGILDRNGNVLLPEASLATLFPGETLGDPVVVYDNFANRFIIMQFSNTPNGFLIAVGQGPDPVNDGWYTYRFNTGSFPDYEKLSIWHDGYYITANKDQNAPDSNDVVFAVERDKMLVGDNNVQMVGFPLPNAETNGFYSPGGFNATGSTLPPAGTGHPIVYLQDDSWSGVNTDHLKIWTIDVDWNNTSNSTISSPQILNTAPFDSVFDGGSFQNLDEPGNGPDIDALQATMMYMTSYRRFATHNSAVMNFVVDVSGNDTRAGIRWYELRQTGDGAPWTIHQEGTYTQPDGHSAFCGGINMDSQGNIGLAYTIVSSTVYTSLRYTGRLASDALNTMTVAEQVIVDGDSQNNRGDGRYGDYAQMTIDPTDDRTFWHIAEYMKGPTNVRKSHVVAFQLEAPEPDNEAPTAPTNLTASNTTGSTTTLSWNAATDNVGVTAYDIYQNGNVIGSSSTTSYTVTGLTPLTTYSFTVIAKDAAGNQSPASNSVSVTTTDVSGCASGVNLPYSEGFENTIGAWTQNTDDDLNWSVDANGTPSNNTGPSSAIEGSYYIYVEASGNGTGYPNKRAIITSPCIDLSGATQANVSFKYHMFGATDMGSIALEASSDDGTTWTTIWSETGNQGDSWQTANINLASYVGAGVQLRFNRLTGGTWRADIAIDDLSVTSSSTPDPCESGDLTLTITFDNYPQETSWNVTDSSGTVVASESYSTANPDGSTITETISNLAGGDYTFTISDSFGDGICCSYGNGSYTLSSNGGTIVSGGDFGNSEATDFCISNSASLRLNTYPLNDTNSFAIYPNPAKNTLNITNLNGDISQLKIFSMYGILVQEETSKTNGNQVDISSLASGTYFVRIVSGDQTITRKFIKK